MKKSALIITLLTLLAAATAGVLVFFYLKNRDERLIRENLDQLAVMIAKSATESSVMSAAKIARPERVFHSTIRIKAPEYSFDSSLTPKDCSRIIALGHRRFRQLQIEFSSIKITVNNQTAEVTLGAALNSSDGGGKNNSSFYSCKVIYCKNDGNWKICGVELIPLLEK